MAKIHKIFSTERPPGTSGPGYSKFITRRVKLTNDGKTIVPMWYFKKIEPFWDVPLSSFLIILINNFFYIP